MITGKDILDRFADVQNDLFIGDVNRLVDELFYCVIVKGFRPTEQQIINVQSFFMLDMVSPHHVYKFIQALTPAVQDDETNYAGLLLLRNPLLVTKVQSAIKEREDQPRQA